MNRKITIFTVVTVLGVVIDQITKYAVRAASIDDPRWSIEVIPHFFDIVHAENPGAALGMLGNLAEPWRIAIFVGFTIVAGVIVFDLFRRLPPKETFLSTTLALIFSGALGNAIDRVTKPIFGMKATVTDFLRFYTDDPGWVAFLNEWVGMAEYPSFNVADINLVVGVGLFLVHYLFIESRNKPEDADSDEIDDDDDFDDEDLDDDADTDEKDPAA